MAGRPLQDGDFVAILNDFDASRLDYLVKLFRLPRPQTQPRAIALSRDERAKMV